MPTEDQEIDIFNYECFQRHVRDGAVELFADMLNGLSDKDVKELKAILDTDDTRRGKFVCFIQDHIPDNNVFGFKKRLRRM